MNALHPPNKTLRSTQHILVLTLSPVMGQTCTRPPNSAACGSCSWGKECLTCVYENPFAEDKKTKTFTNTLCHATTNAVGVQIILPVLFLSLLFSLCYMFYRYHRMRRLRRRAQKQLGGFDVEVAKEEGIFAANARRYDWEEDIFPYLFPICIRTCVLYLPCTVKMTCIPGAILLMLAIILLPLGVMTISMENMRAGELATGGAIALGCGVFLCCCCCCTHAWMTDAREKLAEEVDLKPLRVARQELAIDRQAFDRDQRAGGGRAGAVSAVVIAIEEPVQERMEEEAPKQEELDAQAAGQHWQQEELQTIFHSDPQIENEQKLPMMEQYLQDSCPEGDIDVEMVDEPRVFPSSSLRTSS